MSSPAGNHQRGQGQRRAWPITLFRVALAVILALVIIAGVASYLGTQYSQLPTTTHTEATTRMQSTFVLALSSGAQGDVIAFSGSGYLSAADDCTSALTTQPANLFSNGVATSCTIDVKHNLTGEFAVALDASLGPYTIALIGSFVEQGTVSATFTVTTRTIPTIILSLAQGSGGDNITFTGSGFNPNDTSCSVNFYQMEQTLETSSCHIAAGSVNGWFIVKASGNPAGAREVRVTGDLLDSANMLFTVTPRITVTPNPAIPGSDLTVLGSNYVVPGDCSNPGYWPELSSGISIDMCIINDNYLVSATLKVHETVTPGDFSITLTDGLVQASANLTIQFPTAGAPPSPDPCIKETMKENGPPCLTRAFKNR